MTFAVLLWVGGFRLALALVAVLAFVRGGGPERIIAATLLAAAILSIPAVDAHHAFKSLQVGVAAIDLCVLVILWVVSLHANRWWPMPACGSQLVSCLAHVVKLLEPDQDPIAYMQTEAISAWPTLLLLLGGVLVHARRARSGADPSWSRSPGPAVRPILARLRLD